MKTDIQIGSLIYDKLHTALSGVVVYPLVATIKENADEPVYPFVTYRRTGLTHAYTKDIQRYQKYANIQIDIVAKTYKQSLDIAETVISTLVAKRFETADFNVRDVQLTDANEDYSDGCYIQTLQLQISF